MGGGRGGWRENACNACERMHVKDKTTLKGCGSQSCVLVGRIEEEEERGVCG